MNNDEISKLEIWPRVLIAVNGKDVEPGESAEVLGTRDIGAVGRTPNPAKFYRIDIHSADGVVHQISDSVSWKSGVSKADADAAIPHGKKKAHK